MYEKCTNLKKKVAMAICDFGSEALSLSVGEKCLGLECQVQIINLALALQFPWQLVKVVSFR